MSAAPTAYRSVPSLLTSLRRAGWGDLAGRDMQAVRSTLAALCDRLPHRSGQGLTTVGQVADAAGLSDRWVRRCMNVLEDLGLIEWHRGSIQRGKPAPSLVRIVKTALVDLIMAARPIQEAKDTARALATKARIHAARLWWCGPKRRWSSHAALSAHPHPTRGVTTGDDSPKKAYQLDERVSALIQNTHTNLPDTETTQEAPTMTPPPVPYDTPECDRHPGFDGGTMRGGVNRCPLCRRNPAPKPTPIEQPALMPVDGSMTAKHRENVISLAAARARHGR